MTTSLQGTGLDLTDDVRGRVDAALAAALRPLGGDAPAARAAGEVERTTRWLHRAEVTLSLGRATLRAEATAGTLGEALGEVRQVLAQRAAPRAETGDAAEWDDDGA